MNPRNCLLIGFGIFLVVILVIIVISGCTQRLTTGKLKITSQPEEASVVINEQIYTTPFEIELMKKGDYTVRIYKTGYEVETVTFTINPRKTTEINVDLEELPEEQKLKEGG